jgi:YidC/Oxa1 family membrane protein insertase
MSGIILTQNSTPIFKYIVWILGKIMEGIFFCIDKLGIPNIGLAIILFTLVINLLMLPLTIKQQKFAKLQAKMNPEIQAIQAKYKDKKDNDSNIAQNAEIQAVYAKYGVSPTGSCLYLLIQMPILFALYRVIYAMPAYVTKIGDTFRVLAQAIIKKDGADFLQNSGVSSIASAVSAYSKNLNINIENGVIDVLNKLSSADMSTIASHYNLSELTYPDTNGQLILSNDTTRGLLDTYNNFLGLNIGNSPWYILKEAISNGAWLLAVGAVAIPVLSALSQWINVKLMPQQNDNSGNKSEREEAMASSMKTMNMMMPLMSAYFCFTLPSGMGLYWVAGSVVRSIQQVIINKHIDKMDFDEIINKNSAKNQKKLEKQKEQQEKLNAYANMSTRNIKAKANISTDVSDNSGADATGTYIEAKPGSMMEKANKVKKYNEKNNR